jgi:hypothetical protein
MNEPPWLMVILAQVAALVSVGKFGTPAGTITEVSAPGTPLLQLAAFSQAELMAPVHVVDGIDMVTILEVATAVVTHVNDVAITALTASPFTGIKE